MSKLSEFLRKLNRNPAAAAVGDVLETLWRQLAAGGQDMAVASIVAELDRDPNLTTLPAATKLLVAQVVTAYLAEKVRKL